MSTFKHSESIFNEVEKLLFHPFRIGNKLSDWTNGTLVMHLICMQFCCTNRAKPMQTIPSACTVAKHRCSTVHALLDACNIDCDMCVRDSLCVWMNVQYSKIQCLGACNISLSSSFDIGLARRQTAFEAIFFVQLCRLGEWVTGWACEWVRWETRFDKWRFLRTWKVIDKLPFNCIQDTFCTIFWYYTFACLHIVCFLTVIALKRQL